jgi:pyruvate dehydrogenase E1 component alpha subunit
MTTANEHLHMYRGMLRIRRVEEALAERYKEQQMRCPMHLCIGQEATAAGVCHALEPEDQVFSNHRAHGHYLAKGGDLRRMIAELYGRGTGCCGGRGGSMHLIDRAAGFMGATPIVGGTVPLAVGAAWAAQLQRQERVTVAFFGDGCFEEGVVHESLNFAALKKLPVVFVCENNAYSVYTHVHERQPRRAIHAVAQAHGVRAWVADGNDVLAVHEAARQAVSMARAGAGPQFLELHTHRWREHCGPDYDDHLGYRRAGELDYWHGHCPIQCSRNVLQHDRLLSAAREQSMENEISREIDAAFAYALASPVPDAQFAREVACAG